MEALNAWRPDLLRITDPKIGTGLPLDRTIPPQVVESRRFWLADHPKYGLSRILWDVPRRRDGDRYGEVPPKGSDWQPERNPGLGHPFSLAQTGIGDLFLTSFPLLLPVPSMVRPWPPVLVL